MNMPGFAAEAAIYDRATPYGGQYGYHRQTAVTMQLWKRWPGLPCDPTCACITWENCPCCIGPGPGGGGVLWPLRATSSLSV